LCVVNFRLTAGVRAYWSMKSMYQFQFNCFCSFDGYIKRVVWVDILMGIQ
jgi:hypothetical protein